MFSVLLERLK